MAPRSPIGLRGWSRAGFEESVKDALERINSPAKNFIDQLSGKFVPVNKDANDTKLDITKRLEFEDTASAKGSVINIEHWGDGTGSPNNQAFGFDLHNNPGSSTGVVVHQYSNSTAVKLDNTGTGPSFVICQTNNPVRNPSSVEDTAATGDAIRIINHTGAYWMRFLGRGELVLTPPADQVEHTINATNQAGTTKNLIRLNSNAPVPALQITANASSAGAYPILVSGQNYAAQLNTSTNGGFVAGFTKSGTGNGDVINLRNDGTGKTILIRQGTTTVAQVNADGEVELVTAGKGFLLRSPNGTRYRLSVSDAGAVTATAAP